MFVRANELSGYKLEALDGAIGHVKDFYFEDNNWTVLKKRMTPIDVSRLSRVDTMVEK